MNKEDYKNEQGYCPKCGKMSLDYQPVRHTDDMMCYFPYKCEDCGQEGEEWYRLEFVGHNVITEDGEVIEL